MAKFKVVITDSAEYENNDNEIRILEAIGAEVHCYQYREEDDIIRMAADCDGLIFQCAKITRRVMEAMPRCKVISKYATGIDGVDIPAATEKGICVTNVNEYCMDEVATHAMALLLESTRRIGQYGRWTRSGHWFGMGHKIPSLKKSVVGVISFGRIARAYIDKLKAFCDEIWVYDKFASAQEIEDYGVIPKTFDQLVAGADFISIHAPLTEETRYMFHKQVFQAMKPTATIINVARGGLICEEDLIWALENKEIAFAALDVLEPEPPALDNPLLQMDNVLVTPHSAWYSVESQQKLQAYAAENVAQVLTGQKPRFLVNTELAGLFDK